VNRPEDVLSLSYPAMNRWAREKALQTCLDTIGWQLVGQRAQRFSLFQSVVNHFPVEDCHDDFRLFDLNRIDLEDVG